MKMHVNRIRFGSAKMRGVFGILCDRHIPWGTQDKIL